MGVWFMDCGCSGSGDKGKEEGWRQGARRRGRQEAKSRGRGHMMSVKLSSVVAGFPMVMAKLLGHHSNSNVELGGMPVMVAMAALWSVQECEVT